MTLTPEDVIYQVLIDRFDSEDGLPKECSEPIFCGGTLKGVLNRLDHIASLGTTVLWLSPFNPTTAYHGYHITDFFSVEPRFGTLDDLKDIIKECRSRNIRIMMDFVPNHVSKEHPFFVEAQRDRDSQYHDWFVWKNWPDDYMTFLGYDLPKLDLDHPEAREHIIKAALHWLEIGIDSFRIDHPIGQSHDFWRALRKAVKEHSPDAFIIGEITGYERKYINTLRIPHKWRILRNSTEADMTRMVMQEYVGVFDGALDFEFFIMVRESISKGEEPEAIIARLEEHYQGFPERFRLLSFLNSHDSDRFLYIADHDKDRLKRAASLQASQPQPRIIYYGDEIGMDQDHDIASDSDIVARQPMAWDSIDEDLLEFYRKL